MPAVIDLFSGAGGFSLGFKRRGFLISAAVENFPPAVRTYRINFPETELLAKDVKKVSAEELPREIDVVIAGPPCEAFTASNPNRRKRPLDRLYKDPSGMLMLEAVRLIALLKPKIFIIENVPEVAAPVIRSALAKEFRRIGYPKVYFNLLRAENYGCPSLRRRVFISNVEIRPEPTVIKPVTVREALKGLPPPGSNGVPNHRLTPISRRRLLQISRLRQGEALVRYRGAGGRTYRNWVRLIPDKPAPPVLGNSRFIHPWEDRLLTVREQARLMGFPDDHVFLGGLKNQYDMVGEAVPVPLAEAIAESILETLEEL